MACPALLQLCLAGARHVTDRAVAALLLSAPRLQSLDLSATPLQAAVLASPSITALNLSGCRSLTGQVLPLRSLALAAPR